MGGDEGGERVLRKPNGVGWAKSYTRRSTSKKGGRSFERILQLQLKAGAEPAAKKS